MKIRNIIATTLLAGSLSLTARLANAQQIKEAEVNSSLVTQEVVPQVANSDSSNIIYANIIYAEPEDSTCQDTTQDTTRAAVSHAQKTDYTGGLELLSEIFSEKGMRKLEKKFPIRVNPADTINYNTIYQLANDEAKIAYEKIENDPAIPDSVKEDNHYYIGNDLARFVMNHSNMVRKYNKAISDGKLTLEEVDDLFKPYIKSVNDKLEYNELFKLYPENARNTIQTALDNLNGYVSKVLVNQILVPKLKDALKTSWYKNWKFTVPAAAAVGTAAYFLGNGGKKNGKEKVYNTGDWSNNTY